MCWSVDAQACRQRRPTVGIEDNSAKKMDEPLPVRILIVVGGSMETEPRTTVLHVTFKGPSLLGVARRFVKPDHELTVLQPLIVQIIPPCGCIQRELFSCRLLTQKLQGIFREVNVVRFCILRIEREYPEARALPA